MEHKFTLEDENILGLKCDIESTGYVNGNGSETNIHIKNTTVWGGLSFNTDKNGENLTIKALGDFELYDLTQTLKWIVNKLENLRN